MFLILAEVAGPSECSTCLTINRIWRVLDWLFVWDVAFLWSIDSIFVWDGTMKSHPWVMLSRLFGLLINNKKVLRTLYIGSDRKSTRSNTTLLTKLKGWISHQHRGRTCSLWDGRCCVHQGSGDCKFATSYSALVKKQLEPNTVKSMGACPPMHWLQTKYQMSHYYKIEHHWCFENWWIHQITNSFWKLVVNSYHRQFFATTRVNFTQTVGDRKPSLPGAPIVG